MRHLERQEHGARSPTHRDREDARSFAEVSRRLRLISGRIALFGYLPRQATKRSLLEASARKTVELKGNADSLHFANSIHRTAFFGSLK